MAWENVIVGYKIQTFRRDEVVPADAKFLSHRKHFKGMYGFVSNLQPHYEDVYDYQVAIYKKKNIKKKDGTNKN